MQAIMQRSSERRMGRLAAAATIGLVAVSLAQAQTTPAPDAPDG